MSTKVTDNSLSNQEINCDELIFDNPLFIIYTYTDVFIFKKQL